MKSLLIRLLIISVTIGALTSPLMAQPSKVVEKIDRELILAKKQNDSLQAKLNAVIEHQKVIDAKLQAEQERQDRLDKSFEILNQSNLDNSTLSKIGALILLFGLFIDVIGATLVAGADLSDEVELMRSGKLEYTLGDLAIEDKLKDNVMTFYGILGSVFLVLGFCFQFTGTIIILGLAWYWVVVSVAFAILSSFAVLTFLASQNVNQPLKKKLSILYRNLKRVSLYPLKQRLAGKKTVVCEICQSLMSYSAAEVWYKQEKNSEQYKYLYPPYGFYLGHPKCLEEIYPKREEEVGPLLMPPHPLYKKSALDFHDNYLDQLYDWNELRLKDLQKKRNSNKKIIDETEVSLRNLKYLLSKKTV